MKLKIIATIILTFMLATLLVGCGNTGSTENNGAPTEGDKNTLPDDNKNMIPDNESVDKGDEIPDNIQDNNSSDNATPDENEGGNTGNSGSNTEDDNNNEQIPEGDGNEELPGGNGEQIPEGDGEQTPEESKPEENIPFGTAVGYRFNDLTLRTLDGTYVNTADLRGKVIIFNVWATWCPPCKAELPDFNSVASEYADDVVIIAAHTYDDYAANMPSYVANNFPNTKIIFAYDNATSDAYAAAGGDIYVPQTAIIDKDGIIRYSNSGRLSYSALISLIQDLIS